MAPFYFLLYLPLHVCHEIEMLEQVEEPLMHFFQHPCLAIFNRWFYFSDTGVELELEDNMPFLEWLANNYKQFGATLEIITDRSQEGSQFVRGFGGIGGMLRYKVDFQSLQLDDFDDEDEFDLDDY